MGGGSGLPSAGRRAAGHQRCCPTEQTSEHRSPAAAAGAQQRPMQSWGGGRLPPDSQGLAVVPSRKDRRAERPRGHLGALKPLPPDLASQIQARPWHQCFDICHFILK